jgi:hypothetical protein
MVYTIHLMLYTVCYAGHTTVYIIGIYHGILNDIYMRIYHGTCHNIFSSFISHCILVPSRPPVQCCSRCRFNVWSALASFSQSLSTCSCELQSISLWILNMWQPIQGGIWSSSVNTGINLFDLQHVKVNGTEVV